ncbi:SDR family oxidoreductase [Arcobacteraceae bacterium]|nr:SDR family oxidoreductase [Arcobacteraceae bacterium]
MNKIENRVAIITGASRGIGLKVAEQLASIGIITVINYHTNKEAAEEIVKDINFNGGKAVSIKADISKVSELEKLFKETVEIFGSVDILVNNAGIMINNPIQNVSEEEFDKHFSINVKGTYFACQLAMKYMKDNGRIINISTSVTSAMFPSYSVYAATKGAVEQITRQLAKEFGSKGITINAIAQGPVKTELFMKEKSEQQIEMLSKMNSFGRLGEPEDIADVIELLVSDKSHWITGQTIKINGGFI